MLDGHTPNEVAEMSAKERYSEEPFKDERIEKALKHIYEAIEEFESGKQVFKTCGVNAIHLIISSNSVPSLLIREEGWETIQGYCNEDPQWIEDGPNKKTYHKFLEHDGLIITSVERKYE